MVLMRELTLDKQWGQTLSLDKAQEFVLQYGSSVVVEQVPLQQALQRVLAQDIRTPEDMPPFAVALTDGYAIRHKDTLTDQAIPVIRSPAIDDTAMQLPTQSAAQIVKGARLPMGADTVISLEQCMYAGYQLRLQEKVMAKSNIMAKAEFARHGHVIVQAGRVINNIVLATLAELDLQWVPVYTIPSLSIGIFSSTPEYPLAYHYWLAQAVQGANVEWHTLSARGGENSDNLVAMVQQSSAPLVVLTGDMEQLDWEGVQQLLCGGLHQVVLADGQQLLLGQFADKLVLVLPLLKQELMMVACWLLQPLIRQQLGCYTGLKKVTVSHKFANAGHHERLALAISELGCRGLRVKPCKGETAGSAVQVNSANGMVLIPAQSGINIGQKAGFLRLY